MVGYEKSDAFKKSRCESSKKYRANNSKAVSSHGKVSRAISSGVLEKPDKCQVCNKPGYKIYAHHCDYDMPLDVMWLCSWCHSVWHKNNTPLNKV